MNQTQIAEDELAFHSLSFNDKNGRLFKWRGDIYRAIPSHQTALYQNLLKQGVIDSLVSQKLLIETELTSFLIEDYALVLKHRRIDFVSYPKEWCGQMLKDAALLHLDLCLELEKYDLITADCHPLNILYDGTQPVFIDIGSIEEISKREHIHNPWFAHHQFCSCFLYPLKLMSEGQGRIARWLMQDYEQGVLSEEVAALTNRSLSNLLKKKSRHWLKSFLQNNLSEETILRTKQIRDRFKQIFPAPIEQLQSRRDFYQQLRQQVADIEVTVDLPSLPLDFEYELLKPNLRNSDYSTKLQLLDFTLSDLQPASVLVMGNDRGYSDRTWAKVAAKNSQVVIFSPNETNVTQLYIDAKAEGLSILPLFINFASPSYDLANTWFSPASNRLSCDLVLAFDLIDWLVFRQYLPFDRIVERLAEFANRWLLVEFITPSAIDLTSFSSDTQCVFSWYNLDNFINALSKKFPRVDIVHRYTDRSVALLCSNKVV